MNAIHKGVKPWRYWKPDKMKWNPVRNETLEEAKSYKEMNTMKLLKF
jgi:hypothetical protein